MWRNCVTLPKPFSVRRSYTCRANFWKSINHAVTRAYFFSLPDITPTLVPADPRHPKLARADTTLRVVELTRARARARDTTSSPGQIPKLRWDRRKIVCEFTILVDADAGARFARTATGRMRYALCTLDGIDAFTLFGTALRHNCNYSVM